MIRTLTQAERRRVRLALDGNLPYQELQTPEEMHQFAWHWNWDDGIEPLQWIIQHSACDRGTALRIYWSAAPGWYCQYADREK